MRVLVTGGRDYKDYARVASELSRLKPTLVIHGGASGADAQAASWAERRGVPVCAFAAHWVAYGPSAGPRRNSWMLEFSRPDMVIVFPGGPGTKDMATKAESAGVPVMYVGESVEESGR